jgi:hypothetical protein
MSSGIPGNGNLIHNGQFDLWQRGFLASSVVGFTTADRWRNTTIGTSTLTMSRQSFTLGQTEVPGNPKYFLRCEAVGVAEELGSIDVEQRWEGVSTLSEVPVSLNLWLRRSSGTGDPRLWLQQVFGTGGTPSDFVTTTVYTPTLTSDWQSFTFLYTLPSVSGKTLGSDNNDFITLKIRLSSGLTSINTMTIDIANVQICVCYGTPDYKRRSLADEYQYCSRYYNKTFAGMSPAQNVGETTGEYIFPATVAGANVMISPYIRFPQPMYMAPNITFYNPSALNSQVRDSTAAGNCTLTQAIGVTASGFAIQTTGHASTAVGNVMRVHWTAAAEVP